VCYDCSPYAPQSLVCRGPDGQHGRACPDPRPDRRPARPRRR
ncbi:putative dual-specificity RNA methyltransferase RlmN, partial [Mycobacterium marinum]